MIILRNHFFDFRILKFPRRSACAAVVGIFAAAEVADQIINDVFVQQALVGFDDRLQAKFFASESRNSMRPPCPFVITALPSLPQTPFPDPLGYPNRDFPDSIGTGTEISIDDAEIAEFFNPFSASSNDSEMVKLSFMGIKSS